MKKIGRAESLRRLLGQPRPPGSLLFAVLFLALSLFLLSNLGTETTWVERAKLFAQPAFWPAIALAGMAAFSLVHCLGVLLSHRDEGRWKEALLWLRATEYVLWFMIYVLIVPPIGYLPATVVFVFFLCLRAGYRDLKSLGSAVLVAAVIVVFFKSFLKVKVPGGQIYEYLPDSLRTFMLTYL